MLRIKDDVNLKELENFGFYLEGNTYKKDVGHHKCIAICCIDRVVSIPEIFKCFGKSIDLIKYTIRNLMESGLAEYDYKNVNKVYFEEFIGEIKDYTFIKKGGQAMTKEQEVIEYFKKQIESCSENADICDDNNFNEEAAYLRKQRYMYKTVLNMLNKYSADSAEKDKIIAEKSAEIEKCNDLIYSEILKTLKDDLVVEKNKELDKKDKIIDLIINTVYKRFKAELVLEYGFENEEQFRQCFEQKATNDG